MPSYDTSRYDPPAPVAQVTLRDIGSGALSRNAERIIKLSDDAYCSYVFGHQSLIAVFRLFGNIRLRATQRIIHRSYLVPNVVLLIDTGADVTLLPRTAVDRLGVKPVSGSECELCGFDGNLSTAQAVELDMIFLRKAYRGRYVLTEDECGILGRDVLSNVVLLLDGPRQEWSER